jgi:hypothetical protein
VGQFLFCERRTTVALLGGVGASSDTRGVRLIAARLNVEAFWWVAAADGRRFLRRTRASSRPWQPKTRSVRRQRRRRIRRSRLRRRMPRRTLGRRRTRRRATATATARTRGSRQRRLRRRSQSMARRRRRRRTPTHPRERCRRSCTTVPTSAPLSRRSSRISRWVKLPRSLAPGALKLG